MLAKKSCGKKLLWICTAFAVILVAVCAVYVSDYYCADTEAIAAYTAERPLICEVTEDQIVLAPQEGAKAGMIFYPGGKVEFSAYEPLMTACAEQGILCVLVRMPLNLAVLDMNAAEGIQAQYPEISRWYMAGHSLGGSMAASYLANHAAEYEGLILLGAYSTADLSGSGLKVLSVYGSEDKVLSAEKYAAYRVNLPVDFTEIVLEGGCHAYFGMYGPQEGDGTPAMTNIEQIELTAQAVAALVGE